jgi:glycosyltransferase involved in cell wall biosynthesis
MSDQPLVSIIIPTYNRAHLIGETLDSVIAQTYQNWECIIVDDGSSDNTDEVIGEYTKKDTRFKYYHRPEEHLPGGNGARNYGFKMSQGEYVNWFDSDDLMLPDKLRVQSKVLDNDNNVDVVFSDSAIFQNENNKIKIIKEYKIITNNFITDYVLRKLNAQTGTALWKKNILLYFKYNEFLKQSQDHDYYSRVFSKCPNIKIVNKELTLIRVNHPSISLNFLKHDNEKKKSFIDTYSKLLKVYEQDKAIRIGLINILLGSLVSTLSSKHSHEIKKYFIKKIDKLFNEYLFLSKYKNKWFFLKYLSFLILLTGKGSYRLRSCFKI